jgi:hypothetical protein
MDDSHWYPLQSLDLVEGDRMNMLYVLAKQVEVIGIFPDWSASVAFLANCHNIGLRHDGDGNNNKNQEYSFTAAGRPNIMEPEVTDQEYRSIGKYEILN